MRIIFHIDVNAAFLSWTAAYRCQVLGEQQDLRDIPAAIAGEKANRHGIILAKSLPAKRMGVKTGEPIFQAVKKCPQLVTAPPDYALYTQASRRFIALLRSFTPLVEQYSIDEAWADMTGTERLYGSPVLAARTIKQQIREQLGFTVNIGISSNKLLAKIAGDFEKPDRVHTLFPEEIPEKLWPLPVRELFLVGRATEEKLRHLGIRTIGALAKSDPALLQRYLHKPGLRLWHYANGRCDDALLPEQPENKGYGNSTTLPADVTDFPQAERVLLRLCETVGTRLRHDGKAATCVAVRTRTCQFENAIHQRQLPSATNRTAALYDAACQLLRQMWDRRTPLRQLGVQVSAIEDAAFLQYDLFSPAAPKQCAMDQVMDTLRQRYGEQVILRASALGGAALGGGLDPSRRTGVTKPLTPEAPV